MFCAGRARLLGRVPGYDGYELVRIGKQYPLVELEATLRPGQRASQ
jgi:hypothetical protein